jgi:hypothetical protein
MKKLLFSTLFLAICANSAITQESLIGNWSLAAFPKAGQNAIFSLERDSLVLTKDWKLLEIGYYNIDYPGYGPDKIDLKYKLKMTVEGEYRLDKKYPKVFTSEIIEAENEELAHKSFKEVEKMIIDDIKKTNASLTILSAKETELELQNADGNIAFKYTKPKMLPISKLTLDTIPFFAPEGWRFPENAKELASFPIRLKHDNKNLFTIAKGDFNGNGFIDAVAYLLNPEEGRIALFLNMSKNDGTYELGPYGNADRNTIIENGVIIAPPGEYVNSVTKAKLTLETSGFMMVIFGESTNLIYWDLGKNDWVSVPLGKKF